MLIKRWYTNQEIFEKNTWAVLMFLCSKLVCKVSFPLSAGDYHKKEIASFEHYRLLKIFVKQSRFILFVNFSNSFTTPKLDILMSFFWRLLKWFIYSYSEEIHLLDITAFCLILKWLEQQAFNEVRFN
jgi:hypothetical protein